MNATPRAVGLMCRRIPSIVARVGGHVLTEELRAEAIRTSRRVVRLLGIGEGVEISASYWSAQVELWGAVPVHVRRLHDGVPVGKGGMWKYERHGGADGESISIVALMGDLTEDEKPGILVYELSHHLTLEPRWRSFVGVASGYFGNSDWREVVARAVEYAFLEAGGTGLRSAADMRATFGPARST